MRKAELDFAMKLTTDPARNVAGLLVRDRDSVRTLDYAQVELDARLLAARLIDAFGPAEVKGFQYAAIPRGGIFVLGFLAYALNLSAESLQNDGSTSRPALIVDDCSLTGNRFGSFLRGFEDRQVIFATLYSAPSLRAAIAEREATRVRACISARDLEDLAPRYHPGEFAYQEWKRRWQSHLKGHRYWIGIPELVIFPWSEPDRPVWNPSSAETEDTWRLTPPDRCLKNWAELGLRPLPDLHPSLRFTQQLAYSLSEDRVVLCHLLTEEVFCLEGPAAEIWKALAAYGDLEAVRRHVLDLYDVERDRLSRDVDELVALLLDKKLLERA